MIMKNYFSELNLVLEAWSGAAYLDADSSPQHPQKTRGGLADPALPYSKEAAGNSGHSAHQENSQDCPGGGLASPS